MSSMVCENDAGSRHVLEARGALGSSVARAVGIGTRLEPAADAELIAHLGEVEERRLHLVAACSSMFVYCLKLGMTEDEVYRRIEVARLARRYPAIFPLLANGQLSISVVALLERHLSGENHVDCAAPSPESPSHKRESSWSRVFRAPTFPAA